MNGKDRAQILWPVGAKAFANLRGVEIESPGIDIHQNRLSAGAHNGARRGKEAERGRDDRIARLDAGRYQRQPESFCSRGTTNRCSRSCERADLAFQRLHLGAKNEALRIANPGDGGQNLFANTSVLAPQVKARDRIGRCCSCWP